MMYRISFLTDHPHVLTEHQPQQNTGEAAWPHGTGGTGGTGGWGFSTDHVSGAWGGAENVGEQWAATGNLPQQQGSDDSSLGQSEILQPPPSHTPSVLATIPEQTPPLTPYNQNRRLSDIGETNDEYSDYGNQPDSRTTQNWAENPQSHTLTATFAPSAMGSPASPPTVSLAEAAAVAQKDLQRRGKTTTASEVARRMEESRRHSVDPHHLAPHQEALGAAQAVQQAANKKPMSSASAAAAAMEASHLKRRSVKLTDPAHSQPPPGKTAWTHPKPFMEGGRDPAHIPPDPSWIHTGGNAWSRKHLASKGASAVNWAQPIESSWPQSQPQPQNPYPPPPPQVQSQRTSHKKHYSYAGYRGQRPSVSQQHKSWHSWGKQPWVESETESEEDDAVNIVDSWGTYNSHHADQRNGHDRRSRRRKDEESANWGVQGGWPQQMKSGRSAQRHEGGGYMENGGASGGAGEQWGGALGRDQETKRWGEDNVESGMGPVAGESEWDQAKGGAWSQDRNAPGQGQDKVWGWGQDNGDEMNDSTWNQDANWGKDKGPRWTESKQHGATGWGEQQANDAWGTGSNVGGGTWGQTGNTEWGKQPSSVNEAAAGTRNAMSPQQISQIYNSFLNVGQNQKVQSQTQYHNQKTGTLKQDNQAVWEAESGWGSESDEGENPRRVRFSPKASELWGGSPRSVPSKTVAAAQQQGLATTLINDTSTVRFVESRGAGLAFVSNAFFGNTRLSRERIHWLFPQDKDRRISDLLAWVQKMSFNLGTYGVSLVFCECAAYSKFDRFPL